MWCINDNIIFMLVWAIQATYIVTETRLSNDSGKSLWKRQNLKKRQNFECAHEREQWISLGKERWREQTEDGTKSCIMVEIKRMSSFGAICWLRAQSLHGWNSKHPAFRLTYFHQTAHGHISTVYTSLSTSITPAEHCVHPVLTAAILGKSFLALWCRSCVFGFVLTSYWALGY